MKSIINNLKDNPPFTYPCLMEANGTVVLFNDARKGTVVHITNKTNTPYNFDISFYSDEWSMSDFTKFNNSITLSN